MPQMRIDPALIIRDRTLLLYLMLKVQTVESIIIFLLGIIKTKFKNIADQIHGEEIRVFMSIEKKI